MLRKYPLPNDTQYFIDCAGEVGDLTGAAYWVCNLYGNSSRLDEILEAPDTEPGYRGTRVKCLAIEEYARSILAEIPKPRRAAIVYQGVLSIGYHVDQHARSLANWFYEDSTRGGALEPWRRKPLLRANFEPTPKVARRLHSPAQIRRYVANHVDEAEHLRTLAESLWLVPFGAIPRKVDVEAELAALHADYDAIFSRAHGLTGSAILDADRAFAKLNAPQPLSRSAKKVAKRSAVVAANIVGHTAVSQLAHGEKVVISADTIDFRVRLTGSVAKSGHGALGIEILDKEGNFLSRLCLYQNEVPAFDQVCAIALHAATGDEKLIVDTGNLFSQDEKAAAHPLIQQRLLRDAGEKSIIGNAVREHLNTYEITRARVDAYTEATKRIYVEALRQCLFGRRAKLIPEWA